MIATPSRRKVLFTGAAAALTTLAVGYTAGAAEFDTEIPLFDRHAPRSHKVVGLVFSGHARRIAEGFSLCKHGSVDQLLILGQRQQGIDYLRGRLNTRAYANRVTFLKDSSNTMEEASAVIQWLKSNTCEEVVIVTDGWHSQRCYELIRSVKNQGVHISLHAYGSEQKRNVTERIKLGLTRLSVKTGLPLAGIPGLQIPGI